MKPLRVSPRVFLFLFFLGLSLAAASRARAAAPSPEPSPTKPDYVVGVEDALRIEVWGEKDLNLQVKVRPDGKISFPLAGEIPAAGLRPEELRQEIASRLSKFIHDPNVTVIVDEINSFRVYMLGEVRNQGVQILKGPTRLLQAVAAAGGLTEFSKKELTVIREQDGQERRIRVDYKKLLAGEAGADNILLRPGDTVLAH